VELTECTLMADPPAVVARMHALRQTGEQVGHDARWLGQAALSAAAAIVPAPR
jgi:hypothetical protein